MESNYWCVFLVTRGIWGKIATHETILKLNGDGMEAKE